MSMNGKNLYWDLAVKVGTQVGSEANGSKFRNSESFSHHRLRMDKEFNGLIRSLPQSQTKLYDLVGKALKKTEKVGSPANRRGKWEFLLKLALYDLAVRDMSSKSNPRELK